MNYYLIDYENIRKDGVRFLEGVRERDAVVMFYSEQCKNISLDVIDEIVRMKLQYTSVKAKVGTKNALDFQLASHLGYLIGRGDRASVYYIISNDKGYDCLCEYWKELGARVERIALAEKEPAKKKTSAGNAKQKAKGTDAEEKNLTGKSADAKKSAASARADAAVNSPAPKPAPEEAQKKAEKSKVKASDYASAEEIGKVLDEEDQPEDVLKIFNHYKSKVSINNALSKLFKDSKRGSTIYKKLKPLLKSKNKT